MVPGKGNQVTCTERGVEAKPSVPEGRRGTFLAPTIGPAPGKKQQQSAAGGRPANILSTNSRKRYKARYSEEKPKPSFPGAEAGKLLGPMILH